MTRAGFLLAAALLLAGCASVPAPGPAPEPGQLLSGRIAVRAEPLEPGAPVRASNAAFELRGDADAGELRLSSPLGTVMAVARWRGDRATLEARGEVWHYDTLQALGREMLGEDIPVAALFDWLHGRPWGGSPVAAWSDGRGFDQLGWRVDLARAVDGLVVATRATPPLVTVRARVER